VEGRGGGGLVVVVINQLAVLAIRFGVAGVVVLASASAAAAGWVANGGSRERRG